MKPYTPDFKMAFEHFCIHPGGKAVISEVGSKLQLNEEQCMPMLVPFERYGNTSSSSTWCALERLLPYHAALGILALCNCPCSPSQGQRRCVLSELFFKLYPNKPPSIAHL